MAKRTRRGSGGSTTLAAVLALLVVAAGAWLYESREAAAESQRQVRHDGHDSLRISAW